MFIHYYYNTNIVLVLSTVSGIFDIHIVSEIESFPIKTL
jgi:hypothetical protein